MTRSARQFFTPLGWLLLIAASTAAANDRVLTVTEVLASSNQHFPEILQRMAARQLAAGQILEAEGAFDLTFAADSYSRLSGFYDGAVVQGSARQRFRPLGAELYASYQLSNGDFPIYEDEYYTNTGGTFGVGVLFALLRDREIDEQRFREMNAQLSATEADLDLLLTRIDVQRRALKAYWEWVAAGRRVNIYKELLRIALERQDNLETQVQSGARARIFLTENLQNIVRRQTLVTAAERDFHIAANGLSYFYRGIDGQTIVPEDDRLPAAVPVNEVDNLSVAVELTVSEAVERRPELALLKTAILKEQNKLAIAENKLKPRLDLNLGVKQGLGGVGEGGVSRDSTDTVVGLQFSVPLQRRSAQGSIDQSRARLASQRQKQQLLEDQIQIELKNILTQLTVARQLLSLAAQEVAQSEIMRVSEVRRFNSGASDFFLVNVREETAANARVKYLQAELDTRVARASFDAAAVDLRRLGIIAY